MKKQLVCVVIPIYRDPILSETEWLSLSRCVKVLHKYPIKFVLPKSLKLSEKTLEILSEVEFFNDEYFNGIFGYNRLMTSIEFYERFLGFSYVLIYQLDAFVFKDELEYWCRLGYDYIGAPFLGQACSNDFIVKCLLKETPSENIRRKLKSAFYGYNLLVGNGGFSLRKIETFISARKKYNEVFKNYIQYNEDFIWGLYISNYDFAFKVPDLAIAMRFSIELNAEQLFESIDSEYPFGCHGWSRKESIYQKDATYLYTKVQQCMSEIENIS